MKLIILSFILLTILFGSFWGFGNPTLSVVGAALLALLVLWAVSSFGTVKVDEVAAMFFFDAPVQDLNPGLYFAPLGIFSVKKESRNLIQDELPDDPQNIFREEGAMPQGMFPPFRIKFGSPDPADILLTGDPYNIAMVAEVSAVVSWRITSAIDFFREMGNRDNARKILADKTQEVFGNEFSQHTPAKALLTLSKTSERLEKSLQDETLHLGIRIDDAFVKPFIFSHELNTAVVGVSVADQKAKAYSTEQKAIVEWRKKYLVETGLATVDAAGNITGLVPDANVKVGADALKELAKITGTLVLGGEGATPFFNIKNQNP